MKKILIYISTFGFTVGVGYWIYKIKKNTTTSKIVDKKAEFVSKNQEEKNFYKTNILEESNQVKNETLQNIYERHSEASFIMKDSYNNIMEDFVEEFLNEKDNNIKDKSKNTVIDKEDISIKKEIDSIYNELDEILK